MSVTETAQFPEFFNYSRQSSLTPVFRRITKNRTRQVLVKTLRKKYICKNLVRR